MIFRTIAAWPATHPPTREVWRDRGQFKVSLTRAIYDLAEELRLIGAKDAICEVDVDERSLRRDGGLSSSAVARTPGVILRYTDREGGAVTMPSDGYRTMTANIRGLSLTLAALRAVDRYHVTRSGEQYRGFTALPPGAVDGAMSLRAACVFLARASGPAPQVVYTPDVIARDVEMATRAVRGARARHHPDAGGSDDAFHRVQEAARVMSEHFGVVL